MELLVVIAIISLLAGLLLPALQKARTQAIVAACMSNERQQYMFMSMYAIDYEGNFPGSVRNYILPQSTMLARRNLGDNVTGDDGPHSDSYISFVRDYLKIRLAQTVNWDGEAYRLNAADDVLICPSLGMGTIMQNGLGNAFSNDSQKKAAITYMILLVGGQNSTNSEPKYNYSLAYKKFLNPGKVWKRPFVDGGFLLPPQNMNRMALVFDRLYNYFPDTSSAPSNAPKRAQAGHQNEYSNILTVGGNVVTERRWGKAFPPTTAAYLNSSGGGLIVPNLGYYVYNVGSGGVGLLFPRGIGDGFYGDTTSAQGIWIDW